eukprot:Partr_v1_DN24998_c0_g1_i1_m45161 putative Zinc finger, C2H2 type
MDLNSLLHAAECALDDNHGSVSTPTTSNYSRTHKNMESNEMEAVDALASMIAVFKTTSPSSTATLSRYSPALSSPVPSLRLSDHSPPSNHPMDSNSFRHGSPSIQLPPSASSYSRSPPSDTQITPSLSHLPGIPNGYLDGTEPKPFFCKWHGCKKSFPRKADLTRHSRIHQNIRPFVCHHEQCGKAFSQRSALKVHIRIHTGEKPHVCEYDGCGRAFSDSSSLARHRKLHTTDGLSYACDVSGCTMKFNKKVFLLRHKKAFHSNFAHLPIHQKISHGLPSPFSSPQSHSESSGHPDAKIQSPPMNFSPLPPNIYPGHQVPTTSDAVEFRFQ